MDLPAYLFNSGLTSKLSRWLTPPQRKIQITDFACGVKCGWPSGGRQISGGDGVLAKPSRKSMAERASPVKPMPVSSRNERRVMPQQRLGLMAVIRKGTCHECLPIGKDNFVSCPASRV